MKILIASGTYIPEVSGQSTFASNLVKNWKNPKEISGIVCYGSPQAGDAEHKVARVKRTFWRYFGYIRAVRRIGRETDIIYAQDLVSSGFPAAWAKRGSQKLAIRLGGDFLWERMANAGYTDALLREYYDLPKNILEKIYLSIYRYVLKKADLVIFNTNWQRILYLKKFELPKSRTAVIENPIEEGEHGKTYDSSDDGQEILYAGRFVRIKNLKNLLEAFSRVKTEKKLVLLGQGSGKAKLEKLGHKDGRVSIQPSLPREDLLKRLKQAYLAVLPSLSEMSPNFALEALRLRVPMILTEENGLPEKIRQNFYLVNPKSNEEIKQGIEYFLNPENRRVWIGKLKNFDVVRTWQDVVSEHSKLFRSHEKNS